MQTETYQVPASGGDGLTHGTDGPLIVSLEIDGTLADSSLQFLQAARVLDPTRAQEPPDADTNDLSTINVYTVGVLLLPLILILHLMRLLRGSRDGPSSCTDPIYALGVVALIVVLFEQVD